MVAFIKLWRDIAGEAKTAVKLLASDEIEAKRSTVLSSNLPLKRLICGYTEDSAIGITQETAGVGCHYFYDVAEARGTLNGEVDEWVNLASDQSLSLTGTRIGQ
jgi:hypothetical protein